MTIQAPPDRPEEQHEVPHAPSPAHPDGWPGIKGPHQTEEENPGKKTERKADVTRAQEELEANVRHS